jgi:hypothetical protein
MAKQRAQCTATGVGSGVPWEHRYSTGQACAGAAPHCAPLGLPHFGSEVNCLEDIYAAGMAFALMESRMVRYPPGT